jgi:hypothetical protein
MNTGNKTAVRVCFISPKAYPLFNPDVKKTFGGARSRAEQFTWSRAAGEYLALYERLK